MIRNAAASALLLSTLAALACGGEDLPVGTIQGAARPEGAVERSAAAQDRARAAVGAPLGRRILFGDLHVHSTYSIDAFVYALPFFGGEGTHPPADACDFARHCSQLDFFSINDHAEGLTPERWQRTIDSIRQCNALAGDPADPDLVAFVGWEWTQVGSAPEDHFGHKNVIFPGLADDELPARPITSLASATFERAPSPGPMRVAQAFAPDPYDDFLWWVSRLAQVPNCAEGVDTRSLPPDCRENAATPELLFEKLDQWGLPSLVIPHGLAWGVHAPPGAHIGNQLRRRRHAPGRQRLLEVFSGHGSSEPFRTFPEYAEGTGGERTCPAPTADYLPCCWRAGEIARARCGDLPEAECEARVAEARQLALAAGTDPQRVFPDTLPADWLDCDQCRDCFKPAMNLRPRESAQYAAALTNFDETDARGRLLRFRWGFIGSSDDHKAQPGTGYKQVQRLAFTDSRGIRSPLLDRLTRDWIVGEQQDPQRAQPVPVEERGFRGLLDIERGASFMYTGGLVAVHAEGRDRMAIWDALDRREVYGTSGPRILLWFDLLNAPGGAAPMGSEVALSGTPHFEVRAVGSFVQKPGCPATSTENLPPRRIEGICHGECYHPSDERHRIDAIEVVRIRPQVRRGEDVSRLVEDPWRRFECPGHPDGCLVSFEDPDFPAAGRDTVYYVRALQAETPAINGATVRAEYDAAGHAVRADPCYGSYRTEADDDCLAPVHERAWSSPIYLESTSPAGR